MRIGTSQLCLVLVIIILAPVNAAPLTGFVAGSQGFDEQVRLTELDGVRILTVAAGDFAPDKPTLLILYALPNGNSIEQTIGCRPSDGLDFRFGIQHIGAQMRLLRKFWRDENLVIAYLEATADGIGKSWPVWRQKRPDNPRLIRTIVDRIQNQIPSRSRIALAAHSGGGSFITGYLNAADTLDDRIERIVHLDSNYSYDDSERHGDKLLEWLRRRPAHRLIVIAYDDRNIMLNGKPVVSPTGGTWRASYRMIDRFGGSIELQRGAFGEHFDTFVGLGGQVQFFLHRNPKNQILHTTLVGEMCGFLHAITLATPYHDAWGRLAAEVPYKQWIADKPIQLPEYEPLSPERTLLLPRRPDGAMTASAFIDHLAKLPADQREQAILKEVRSGNVPGHLRALKAIRVKHKDADGTLHTATYHVTPDYLAIGSDDDFVRIPMRSATAQTIADLLDCTLPTRKMVDDIDARAEVKLAPQPMAKRREAPQTFLEHHRLVERKRKVGQRDAIVCGVKKDIVITNRLSEQPNRLAIYGWRKLDGQPIQPLSIVHRDAYVDYSHGVRLIARVMEVDGKPTTVEAVLRSASLYGLLSDEGRIDKARY